MAKSLTKNSIFYLLYNVLNILFPFITGLYVARVLLPESIGEVAYAQNIVQYFVILAFLGIPTYGLREVAKARNNKEELSKIYSELVAINFISTCIFSAVYFSMIFIVPAFREQITLYLIVGILLLLNMMNNAFLYEGLEEFTFISVRNVVFKAASFIFLVAFVRGEGDYLMYALVTVVGTAGNYILNVLHAGKFVKFSLRGLNLKRHLKPIFLLVAVNLAIEIYTLVDVTMIGIFCDKENVAFYSYGSKINQILLQIVHTFTMVLVPRIALYYKEGKMDEFNELLTKVMKIIIILAVPMIIGIQFVSEFLVCQMYGDAYINSAYVLRTLSFVLLISPIGYLLGSRVMLISNHEPRMVLCVGIGAVVNVIGNAVLIQFFKEYGAAMASVISENVVMIIYVLNGRKVFNLNKFYDTVVRVLICGGVMTAYLFGCTFIPLGPWPVTIIQIVGAVIIYAAGMLIAREEVAVNFASRLLKRPGKNA